MAGAYKEHADSLERMQIDLAVADYVYIDSESPTSEQTTEKMRREPEGLSSQTMVSWLESLLEDPKNR